MIVCIAGFKGVGKTTFLNKLKSLGQIVFNIDDFITDIYRYNEVGFLLIKNEFGKEFVKSTQVDRVKLNKLVVEDINAFLKLKKVISKLIVDYILDITKQYPNDNVFIEQATLINDNEGYYKNLYDKVIFIERKNVFLNNNHISKYLYIDRDKDFKYDYHFTNNKTIEDFENKITLFINQNNF
jgi:dephospho-CoA kinase